MSNNGKALLQPYKDSKGIKRCRGRIARAKVSHSAKFPAPILSDHHLTTLIINKCYNRVGQSGVKETLTELRLRFWVIRNIVRNIIYGCVACQRFETKPYASLMPAQLPTYV